MNRKQRKRRQARRNAPAGRATGGSSGPLFVAEFDVDFGGQEQAEEFRAEIRQLAENAPQKIKELQADLVDLLAPFDAFDIVANLWMVNTPKDPNTYRESDQAGLMCIPDYVAIVCSQRSSRSPTADPATPAVMGAEILDKADELTKSIFDLTNLHLAHKAKEGGSSFEKLRSKLVARRMFVQGPGFEFQLRELMSALFGREKTKEALLAGIGFTAEDALAISDAVLEVSLRKFAENSRSGQALRGAVEEAVQSGDTHWVEQVGLPAEQLSGMSKTERARTLRDLGRLFTFSNLGTTMQVTVEEVASESGVDPDRVKAFFEAFSTDFVLPAKTLMATEVLRGRERPILADEEGNYLLVSHLALLWSLRPALEDSLKIGSGWHQFERDRAARIETAALHYLGSAMPASRTYRSVSFELEEDGNRIRYEIDGLLICDTIMLVIEAKSGSLSASGRGGSPARLEKHLREILVKAAVQADRARRALDQGDCVFVAKNGEEVDLPAQVSEIFPIVVTLEDLSEVTTVIWELESAGLLPADIPTPWALSLFELELISDLTEYAAMLIHFLRRRARLNVLKRVRASDELDWWMHYLERGLHFDQDFDGSDAPDVISLMSMTDPIDAYYLWKRGDRTKPAPKPRQRLKRDLRALLDTLHDHGQAGHIEVSVALLDLDDHGREELMRGFRRIRAMTEEDGEFHNMSILVGRDDSLGITFVTASGSDIGRLENRLGLYSVAKKHQMRLRRWVSLGWCSGTPHLLDLVGLFIGDWHPDPELDELLKKMELDPSEPMDTSDDQRKIHLPKVGRRPPRQKGRKK